MAKMAYLPTPFQAVPTPCQLDEMGVGTLDYKSDCFYSTFAFQPPLPTISNALPSNPPYTPPLRLGG